MQYGSWFTKPASTCAASAATSKHASQPWHCLCVLLVAFVSVGGGNKTFVQDGQTIKTAVFFVPGLIALAVISASFSNLLTDLVAQRDSGVLKRRRATPVPAFALIGGRTLTAATISLVTAVLLLLVGGNVYDMNIPNNALPAVAVMILFGSVTFSALAYALAPSIRSSGAIQPVIQLILLPLYAISGVLLPNSKNPHWLNEVAGVLPLQHLAHGLHHAFDPTTHGIGLSIVDLAVLSAWAVTALVLATRRFTWLPASS